MTFEEQEQLIALWRERCATARNGYEVAVSRSKQLADQVREGAITGSDGGFSLRHALKEQTAAHRAYVSALKTCSKVMLGEIPDEEG